MKYNHNEHIDRKSKLPEYQNDLKEKLGKPLPVKQKIEQVEDVSNAPVPYICSNAKSKWGGVCFYATIKGCQVIATKKYKGKYYCDFCFGRIK